MESLKNRLLIKGVLFDLAGMATYAIPLVGPFLDIAWAPFAAKKMRDMYPGKKGKLASILVFLEEILPGTDLIPSFTLMWFYTFVWTSATSRKEIILEAETV